MSLQYEEAQRTVESTPPSEPPAQPPAVAAGQSVPPSAVGLLAAGVYGLLVMSYAAYQVAFNWDQLVALEETRGDVLYAAVLMTLIAWAAASSLVVASLAGLGLPLRQTMTLGVMHFAAGVGFIILMFVAALPTYEWQIGFIVDAGLLLLASLLVTARYRRWADWTRGVVAALFATGLLAVNAYLLGGHPFEFYWLVALLGILAFAAGWLWSRYAARG